MLIYYRIKLRDQCEAIGSPILSHAYLTLSCFLPSDLLHLVHLVQEDAVPARCFCPAFRAQFYRGIVWIPRALAGDWGSVLGWPCLPWKIQWQPPPCHPALFLGSWAAPKPRRTNQLGPGVNYGSNMHVYNIQFCVCGPSSKPRIIKSRYTHIHTYLLSYPYLLSIFIHIYYPISTYTFCIWQRNIYYDSFTAAPGDLGYVGSLDECRHRSQAEAQSPGFAFSSSNDCTAAGRPTGGGFLSKTC